MPNGFLIEHIKKHPSMRVDDCKTGFDYALAFHCAPVLAGVKIANLICLSKSGWNELCLELSRCARVFALRQIHFQKLTDCGGRICLLVYRRDMMLRHLSIQENRCILRQFGYAESSGLGALFLWLASAWCSPEDFLTRSGYFSAIPPPTCWGLSRTTAGISACAAAGRYTKTPRKRRSNFAYMPTSATFIVNAYF